MRVLWIASCTLALLATASLPVRSDASTLEVRYFFQGFPLQITNGQPLAMFPLLTGSLTFRYASNAPVGATGGAATALPGPVTLVGGALTGEQVFTLSGMLPGSGVPVAVHHWKLAFPTALGTLRPTGSLLLPGARATASLRSTILQPPLDPETYFFAPIVFDWSAPLHLDGGLLDPHALVPLILLQTPSRGFGLAGAFEIDRVLVPEPGTLPTTLAGLASLALYAARRRRR